MVTHRLALRARILLVISSLFAFAVSARAEQYPQHVTIIPNGQAHVAPAPQQPIQPAPVAAVPASTLPYLEQLATLSRHLVLQLGRAQAALILVEQATSYVEAGAPKLKHILSKPDGETRGIDPELATLYPFAGHANWVYRLSRANVAFAKVNQLPDWPELNDRLPGTSESVGPLKGFHTKFVTALNAYFPILETAIKSHPGFHPENVRANVAQLKPTLAIIDQLVTDLHEIYVKEQLNHKLTYDLPTWSKYLFYSGVK